MYIQYFLGFVLFLLADKQRPPIYWFTAQMPTMARLGQVKTNLGNQSRSLMWVTSTQSLEPSPLLPSACVSRKLVLGARDRYQTQVLSGGM